MELELIASLKRNLTRHKDWEKREGFDWPAWQALKLRAIGRYKQENRQIIQQYMEVIGPETEEMLQAQFAEGRDETAAGYEDQTGHTPVSDGAFFGVNAKRMNALLADTQQLEEKASSAALRMMDDVYRQTLHRAEIAMAAGTVTLPKAIDMAVEDFLRVGINCIEYKNGRRVNIADYAEMALRTAATRAKLQGDAAMRARLGVDTVRVSQYGMCSDTCLPWQGRVYIDDVFGVWNGERAGKSGQSVNGNWYPLLSEAVENGLFHPNCRHTLTTWYEGISTMSVPMDPEKIRKNAALEQEQRRLERAVRQAKRLEMGSTDTESIRKYSLQRRTAQKKLKAFVDQHSDVLRRAPWKEKVYEGQKPQLQQMQTAEVEVEQAEENAVAKQHEMSVPSEKETYKEKQMPEQTELQTPPQDAILTEDDEQFLYRYKSAEGYLINAALRGEMPMPEEYQSVIDGIDRAMSKLPEYKGTVYRSLRSEEMLDPDVFLAQHIVDQYVSYPAYTSASTEIYDETMDIQLVIQCHSGRDMRKINPLEQEILFNRNTRFLIEKVEGKTIWLTEI